MIIYSDFECPYCATFAGAVFPELVKQYIEPGTLAVSFQHLPLQAIHPVAMTAAEAAHCAGEQGQFWNMHDQLFAAGGRLTASLPRQLAETLGLDLATFERCTVGAREIVRGQSQHAMKIGLTGTPSFLIGRLSQGVVQVSTVLVGAQAFSAFASAIEPLASQ